MDKKTAEIREAFEEPHRALKILSVALAYLILPLAGFRPDLIPADPFYRWAIEYNTAFRIIFFSIAVGNLLLSVTAMMLCNYMDSSVVTSRRWASNVMLTGIFAFWLLVKTVYRYELTQDPAKSTPIKLHQH